MPEQRQSVSNLRCSKQRACHSNAHFNCKRSLSLEGRLPDPRLSLTLLPTAWATVFDLDILNGTCMPARYDMEDAMILNKSSVERGFAHASLYKTEMVDLRSDGGANRRAIFRATPSQPTPPERVTARLHAQNNAPKPRVRACPCPGSAFPSCCRCAP